MNHLARRHPLAFGVLMLILSPYILAYLLAFALLYGAAVVADMLAGRR